MTDTESAGDARKRAFSEMMGLPPEHFSLVVQALADMRPDEFTQVLQQLISCLSFGKFKGEFPSLLQLEQDVECYKAALEALRVRSLPTHAARSNTGQARS